MATYQEQTGGTLPFYNEAYQRLIQDAEARAKQQMGMTPPPQTVAGFTPMQEEAFKLAGSSVGQYQPWLEQAQQFATQAGQGAQFDPSQVQQYLSPYLSGVVGEIGRLGQEQFQQQVIPGITGAMGGLGQFGSARQAAMLADASGRSQREILGQQANALNTGYNQAMGAYGDWTKMGIGAQQQAAQQLGNLAQAGQGMTTQDIAQLTTAGKTQQDLAQQQANLPFTNWMTQQQYPWQVQNQWANLFKTAPTSQTSWNTGFKKGGLARYADGGRFSEDELEDFIRRIEEQESGGRRFDRSGRLLESPKGAKGEMQVMDATNLDPGFGVMPARDASPDERARVGRDYARAMFERYGEAPKALAAYNAGPGRLDRVLKENPEDWLSLMPGETQNYVSSILGGEDIVGASLPTLDTAAAAGVAPLAAGVATAAAPAAPANDLSDLVRQSYDERMNLLRRAQAMPELQTKQEPHWAESVGRAMLESSAQGPANIGQLIGRAGSSYFAGEDAREAARKNTALARLAIEEKLVPDVPASYARAVGASRAAAEKGDEYYSSIGSDGKRYLFNRRDPTDVREIGSGENVGKRMEAAERYAREKVKREDYATTDDFERAYRGAVSEHMEGIGVKEGVTGKAPIDKATAVAAAPTPQDENAIIRSPKEIKTEEAIGKGAGEQYAGFQKQAVAAGDLVFRLAQLEDNMEGWRSGKFAPAVKELASWLKPVGIDIDETLSDKEAFQSGARQLTLLVKNMGGENTMPGALSDQDRAFLEEIAPSITNTPEGNKLIIGMMRKLAKRQIETAKLADEYVKSNPRKTYDSGFVTSYLQDYSNQNNLFGDEERTLLTAAQGRSGGKGAAAPAAAAGAPQQRNVTVDW